MTRPLGRHHWGPQLELPVTLDRAAGGLSAQLAQDLRRAIEDGRLAPGQRLPSSRVLARDLQVSRTVSVEAYERLTAEGYLRSVVGSGTYVESLELDNLDSTADVPADHIPDRAANLPAIVAPDDLAEAWAPAWRHVARLVPPNRYVDARGELELRRALAAYLRRSRGLVCHPDQVVVTSGTVQSLDLLLRAESDVGAVVGLEEPSDPAVNAVITVNRDVVRVGVDRDGLRVRELPVEAAAPQLVYVTPSHQYPLGYRMSIARRLELIAWARQQAALILEDDYDSEFRYHGPPLPTLFSLAPGYVAYLGTTSKVLTPVLRCGYVVATAEVAQRLSALKRDVDGSTSWPVQMALAHLIGSGELEKHVRRRRRAYAKVRAALERGLSGLGETAEVTGLSAGLNVVVRAAGGLDMIRVMERLEKFGSTVQPLADHFHADNPDTSGILIRYGALTQAQATAVGQAVCRAVSESDLARS